MSSNGSSSKKVVLAYSGGLDTSCILKWLIDEGYDVIAYTADIGQPNENLDEIRQKALTLGASQAVVEDLKDEFVRDFIWPWLRGGALYEDRYMLGTALGRPLIAQRMIGVAKREGAEYISHGATGKGNDQIRLELASISLCPEIKIIAPWREPAFLARFKGRQCLINYAHEKNIPVAQTKSKPYSTDSNLVHISYESGVLEDPGQVPPADMMTWTTPVEQTPDVADVLLVTFEKGTPVKVEQLNDDVKTKSVADTALGIMQICNEFGAKHGIGRIDIVENRQIGIKSRGCYETPGLTILYAAHLDLEVFTLDREVRKIKRTLADKLTEQVYNGMYPFSPESQYVLKCTDASQESVNGTVRVRLLKGNVYIESRTGSSSYSQTQSSMDELGNFEQHSTGFIGIQALRLRSIAANKVGKQENVNASTASIMEARKDDKNAVDTGTYNLWGGRFGASKDLPGEKSAAPSQAAKIKALFDKLNRSTDVDIRLRTCDLRGSIAYAEAIRKCGILSDQECTQIVDALHVLLQTNNVGLNPTDDEDVHTLNERMLVKAIGPEVGGKLHTGRSRNEQVALDTKLWTMDAVTGLLKDMAKMLSAFSNKSRQLLAQKILVAGFTHSQPAQPVALAHWLMSHAWPLLRDYRRLNRLLEDMNMSCPLGSGAIAGNPLGVDRQQLAKSLGFTGCTQNSMDAVSDRDFIIEFHFFASMLAIHLSRFAEDLIIYSGPQYGFVSIADEFCTGSSLMSQKRNPDALELLRSKPAKFCGHLFDVLMLMKALPSCYNKDLQEDKRNLFASYDQLKVIMPLVAELVSTITANADQCQKSLSADMLATDLAYFLVRKEDVPFRTAHHAAGRVVRYAEMNGKKLDKLSVDEIIEAVGANLISFKDDGERKAKYEELSQVFKNFNASVEQYNCEGGTAFAAVEDQLDSFQNKANFV